MTTEGIRTLTCSGRQSSCIAGLGDSHWPSSMCAPPPPMPRGGYRVRCISISLASR